MNILKLLQYISFFPLSLICFCIDALTALLSTVCCQRVPAGSGHSGHGGVCQQEITGQTHQGGQWDKGERQGMGDVPSFSKWPPVYPCG